MRPYRERSHAQTPKAEACHAVKEARVFCPTNANLWVTRGRVVLFSRVWEGSAGDRRPYADQVGLWEVGCATNWFRADDGTTAIIQPLKGKNRHRFRNVPKTSQDSQTATRSFCTCDPGLCAVPKPSVCGTPTPAIRSSSRTDDCSILPPRKHIANRLSALHSAAA